MARGFGSSLGIGSTDSVVSALTTHATQRSYSLWAFRNGDGGGALGSMFRKRTVGAADILQFVWNNPTYDFSNTWSGGGGTWSIAAPAAGAWHQFLIVYDSGATTNVPTIYMDGIARTVTPVGVVSGTINTNTDPFVVGNRTNDNARNWDGLLAEFAVWDGLLTAADAEVLWRGADADEVPNANGATLVEYLKLSGGSPEAAVAGNATVTGTKVQHGPDWLDLPRLLPNHTKLAYIL